MAWGGPFFVLTLIAISTIGWIATTWIRARHGYPVENEWSGKSYRDDSGDGRRIGLLTQENERLTGQVSRLEDRIAVLERIATDPSMRTAREIEALR